MFGDAATRALHADGQRKRYLHPTVGPLTLRYEALPLADDGDHY